MGFIEEAREMQKEARKNKLANKTDKELLGVLENEGNKRDTEKRQENATNELYKRMIDNIRISEEERIKINKNDFEDKDEVIDILLYVVGKMSQDTLFYKTNIQKLKGHKPIYDKAE